MLSIPQLTNAIVEALKKFYPPPHFCEWLVDNGPSGWSAFVYPRGCPRIHLDIKPQPDLARLKDEVEGLMHTLHERDIYHRDI